MKGVCTDCNNKFKLEELNECSDCGAYLCPKCFKENLKGVCKECEEDLNLNEEKINGGLSITYAYKSSNVAEQVAEKIALKNEIKNLLKLKGYTFSIKDV